MAEVPLSLPAHSVPRLELARDFEPLFGGFADNAFEILERLRKHPHIEQYRKEREAIDEFIKQPFRQYRDDIVVSTVLPNRVALETERNVFSRLLKNDFGRGGCHHHYWMSFYRPGWTRLRDLQLIHSMHPDAIFVGVNASSISRAVLNTAREAILASPQDFSTLIEPFLRDSNWTVSMRARDEQVNLTQPPASAEWADYVSSMQMLRVMRRFRREEVVALGAQFVHEAASAVAQVWPIYIHLLPPGSTHV